MPKMFTVSLLPWSFCLFADHLSLSSIKPVFLVNESTTLRHYMESRHKVISNILISDSCLSHIWVTDRLTISHGPRQTTSPQCCQRIWRHGRRRQRQMLKHPWTLTLRRCLWRNVLYPIVTHSSSGLLLSGLFWPTRYVTSYCIHVCVWVNLFSSQLMLSHIQNSVR